MLTEAFPAIYIPSVINWFIFGHGVLIYYIFTLCKKAYTDVYLNWNSAFIKLLPFSLKSNCIFYTTKTYSKDLDKSMHPSSLILVLLLFFFGGVGAYDQSRLFHSFWAEPITRWAKTGDRQGKQPAFELATPGLHINVQRMALQGPGCF